MRRMGLEEEKKLLEVVNELLWQKVLLCGQLCGNAAPFLYFLYLLYFFYKVRDILS